MGKLLTPPSRQIATPTIPSSVEILELLWNRNVMPASVFGGQAAPCEAGGEEDEEWTGLEVIVMGLELPVYLRPAQWLRPLRALERQPSVQASGFKGLPAPA